MKSRFLEDRELEKLLACLKPGEDLPIRLALETGLRVGDCVALRPLQVFFRVGKAERTFIFYKAEKTGKIGHATISEELALEIRRQAGEFWCFPSKKNPRKHIRRETVWARLKRAAERAGINAEGVSPHALRKCFGVKVFKEHGIVAAKNALQHSDVTTTEIYALSDFLSGENAKKVLTRGDLLMVLRVLEDSFKNS